MTLEELRAALGSILVEEQRPHVDWGKVEALCIEVVGRLNTEPEPEYPHEIVYHFLDDPDVRRKSPEYAEMQQLRLQKWLGGD